jgi:hypothetical protein
MKLNVVVFIACILVPGIDAAPNRGDLPASRFPDWKRAAISFPTSSWATVEVVTLGIKPGNALSDSISKKFMAALAAKPATGTIYHFPAGSYTFEAPICIGPAGFKDTWNVTGADVNNVVIKGDGPGKTRFLFNCDVTYFKALLWVEKPAGYSARNAEVSFATPPTAGSSVLSLPPGSPKVAVGDLVEIKSDNDPALMFPVQDTGTAWYKKFYNPLDSSEGKYPVDFAESYGQISEVTAVSGTNVTIDPPLALGFKQELNPRMSVYAAKNRNDNIGIQDLYIEHAINGVRVAQFGTNDIFDIAFRFVKNGFVRNVESYNTSRGHVIVEYSHNVLVTGSKFSYARNYGTGGAGYGVCVQNRSSSVTIENNEFLHLRHAVVLKEGANHTIVGYNWSHDWAILDPSVVDSTGKMIQAEADLSNHGMYPHNNLFEGNVGYNIVFSDYWGPTGPKSTGFRNSFYGVDSARCGIKIHDFSQTQNAIANIIPAIGTLAIDTSCHDEYLEGNVIHGTAHWNSLSALSVLPPSLYLDTTPDFWPVNLPFPPFGPDISNSSNNTIPAMQRGTSYTKYPRDKNRREIMQTSPRIECRNRSIVFTLDRDSPHHIVIQLFDCTGKMVQEVYNGPAKTNIVTGAISKPLASGLYLCRINNGTNTFSTPILIREF